MFIVDLETLGKESNAVILSIGAIHFSDDNTSIEYMRDNSFFVKIDASDQYKRLKRTYSTDTIQWWKKQCENARITSYKPNINDVKLEDALEKLRSWSAKYSENESWVWARGSLDELVLESAYSYCNVEPIFHYARWRDVRTAIDIMYNTRDGYCGVDYPGFDSFLHITKHQPVDDCLFDAMMLLYGVKKES
jgi:hypothetical protein